MRNQGMDAITKIINKWWYWDLDSAIPTLEPVLNYQAIVKMLIAYARLGIVWESVVCFGELEI